MVNKYIRYSILNPIFFILLLAQHVEAKPFTDSGDGTIKDIATTLIWQKCSGGLNVDSTCSGTSTTYTWANAITYCNSLTLANKTWRLPNRNELETILDLTKTSSPAIDSTAFPTTLSNSYWSSTTSSKSSNSALQIDFSGSGVIANVKSSASYVRCVSGP